MTMFIGHQNDLTHAASMWRYVLAQAVHDLYSGQPQHRSEAIRWLCSKDFDIVCDFADVEPHGMKEQMLDLSKLPSLLARKYGKLLRSRIIYGVHHCQ